MAVYQSPGVYIVEEDRGTKPIEAVGTAVAAFVGFTEKAEEQLDGGAPVSLLNKSVAVANWSQYVEKFGGFVEGAYLPYSVYGYFQNGGSRCYIISVKSLGASLDPELAAPAVVALPSRAEKPADTLEIAAKSGGPGGNEIKVSVKDGEDEQTFTLVIESPAGTETFSGLTLGKGEDNVVTVLEQRSKLVTVKVLKAAGSLAERRPKAGIYNLGGGMMQFKSVAVADYRGQAAERTGL
jgi:hypothetical protein